MKRVATEFPPTDRLPEQVAIVRERRRSVELAMAGGKLVARVPRRIGRKEMAALVLELRARMNEDLRRDQIVDDAELTQAADVVRSRYLADLELPPYSVRFAGRMRKRWASCTVSGRGPERMGSLRVSRLLRGHPRWLLEHLLLHELIHLRVADHGPRFQALLARSPHGSRADGYLEALQHGEQWGQWLDTVGSEALPSGAAAPVGRPQRADGQLELRLPLGLEAAAD